MLGNRFKILRFFIFFIFAIANGQITINIVPTPVTCNGLSDGKAEVTVTGGTAPYNYNWTTINGSGLVAADKNQIGLTAGNYTLKVTDSNLLEATTNINITQPAVLTALATEDSSVKCKGGADGEATVTVSGGTPLYTYSWDKSASKSATATDLAPGVHTITITDANYCETETTVIITEPPALVASASQDSPVKCYGDANGVATVLASGGTPNYTYLWDSGATSATATNLAAGIHTITITDANGCEITIKNVIINEPTPLTATIESIPVKCSGDANGEAVVLASGGVFPYTYSWDDSGLFTINNSTANNLDAGIHTIIIKDANGCEFPMSVLITEPDPLTATAFQVSPVKCKGDPSGEAKVTPSGGTPPYIYDWENSLSTTDEANDLAVGKHTITIKDDNGCVFETDVMITEPIALALTAVVQPITCNTGGSITANVTGGVSTSYFYTWEGPSSFSQSGANLKSITNLSNSGTYKLTVADDNDCEIIKYFTLDPYVDLEYTGNTSIVFDTCDDAPTFEVAIADIRGGLPYFDLNGNPYYNYEWFGPNNYRSNQAIIPIEPGLYTLIIKDSKNCQSSPIGFTVSTPYEPIVVSEEIGKVSCDSLNNDGYISIAVNGGNTPYNILWEQEIPSTTPGNTNPSYTEVGQNLLRINNLMEGRYRLTVTSSNLPTCSDNNPAYKFQTTYTVSTENTIRILENPVLDNKLCTGNSGKLTVKVIDENDGLVSFYYNGLVATAEDLGNSNYLVYIDNPIVDGILNIVNEVGCGEAVVINISVVEPSFDISSERYNLDGIVNLNEVVTFINTSTENFLRLEWNFGDGSPIDETEAPTHAYAVSGIYDATLRFYNEFDCYKETTLQIKVGSGNSVRFPDIFTPNRDGINDYFEAVMIGIARFDFEVYDLWNNLIYTYNHTSGPVNNNWGWDGNLPNGNAFTGKIFKYVFIGYNYSDEQVTINNQALLLR